MTFASRTSDAHQTEVMVRLLRVDLADPGVIHFQAEGLAGMPPPVFPSTPETVRTTDLILMGMARTMIGALMFLAARGGARSETVRPDDRLQRARLKNDKPPLYSYARLRIDVGKPEREPGLAGPGGARSPVRGHTVRGHMMRCRKGLVWRRPHIRGDLSRGFVVKTYDLAGSPEATP